jgi:hypothetical protein
MYTDKTGQAEYAPFYVYEVEGNNVDSGVEDVIVKENMTKVIKNGKMYIIRDGKAYNVLGAQL